MASLCHSWEAGVVRTLSVTDKQIDRSSKWDQHRQADTDKTGTRWPPNTAATEVLVTSYPVPWTPD